MANVVDENEAKLMIMEPKEDERFLLLNYI
jgi:hypothetical protein